MAASVLLGISLVLLLLAWEWFRPRDAGSMAPVPRSTSKSVLVGDADSAGKGADVPPDIDGFVEKVKGRYRAMHDRYVALEHKETCIAETLDSSGMPTNAVTTVERVWFEKEVERRLLLDSKDPNVDVALPPKSKIVYPFYREDVPGTYQYFWEGVEEVDGRPLVRLRFEPKPPLADKMSGYVWADPKTGQPCKFDGLLAETPALVDHFRMLAWYAPSENGDYQLRQMVTEGSGGFAFVRRRYRKSFEYSDYRLKSP
ncbi:MAG: hypothetical protein U1D30_15930 [Planctomycetota bacterium]